MFKPRLWVGAACLVIGCDQGAPPVVEKVYITEPCVPTEAAAAPPNMSNPMVPIVMPPAVRPPPPPPVGPQARWFRGLTVDQKRGVKNACAFRKAHPCQGAMQARTFTDADPDLALAMLEVLPEADRPHAETYCRQINPHRSCMTPLVLAFEDEAIEISPSGGAFAFAGSPVHSDWPTATTPWIALDRDGDGAITSGAELFGDGTPLGDGTTAHDGYAALATLDANHDGVIDNRDPMFARLLLWADRDGDRKSTPAELRPLAETVTRIPLAHSLSPRCDARGNCEGERGSFDWQGHTGSVVDLYLATSPMDR